MAETMEPIARDRTPAEPIARDRTPAEPVAWDREVTKKATGKAVELDRLIVKALLAKYESSAHYRSAGSNRRVLLKLGPRSRDLKAYDIENVEQKEAVHAAIFRLKAVGLVDFSWERFNAGNVMAQAWLSLDQIDAAYAFAGLTPKRDQINAMMMEIEALIERLEGAADSLSRAPGSKLEPPDRTNRAPGSERAGVDNRVWILPALRDMASRISASHNLAPALPEDPHLAQALLTAMSALAQPDFKPTYLRVFSIQCFQDSKYLERALLARLVSLVRKYHPLYRGPEYPPVDDSATIAAMPDGSAPGDGDTGDCAASDSFTDDGSIGKNPGSGTLTGEDDISTSDAVLSLIGLSRNPEIYEFCGPVRLTFDAGPITLDYAAFPDGACLSSSSVDRLVSVDAGAIRRLLFIENRTSYEAYIQNRQNRGSQRPSDNRTAVPPGQDDGRQDMLPGQELVVYHGGFHGPVRLQFFRKLVAALPEGAMIDHWGDIDLGGLRIFLQIRNDIAPGLRPWRMDAETLHENKDRAIGFSQAYRKSLEQARHDPAFQDFRPLIEAMLETGRRLEQEALIS